jgi:hypothetical protein
MHYNLLFNGCSHTWGAELHGINFDQEYQRTHRYSHLVATHFGMTYDNIGLSGKSNDWIVEQTIKWFEEGNTCDMAVIQLTDKKRTITYADDETEVDITQPTLKDNSPASKILFKKFNYSRVISNIYFKNIYSEYLGQQNLYKNLFLINNYFKSKNIKVIFLSLRKQKYIKNTGWKKYCDHIKLKHIAGDILPYVENDKDKIYYCQDYSYKYEQNSKFAWMNGAHPNEFGHQKIAQYIIEEMQLTS